MSKFFSYLILHFKLMNVQGFEITVDSHLNFTRNTPALIRPNKIQISTDKA